LKVPGTHTGEKTMHKLIDMLLANPLIYRLHAAGVDRHKLSAITRIRDDFSRLKVLDLGCGPGNATCLFPKSNYTGIDLSKKYIELARKKYPRHHFIAGDAGEIDWDGGYDLILINSLLHHLPDEAVSKIARKAVQSLAAGGIVIIQEPLLPRTGEWYHRLMMRLDRGNYFRSLEDWKRLLGEEGLTAERTELYNLRIIGIYGYHYISICFVAAPAPKFK
jgi:trans-aconitate methyltransferase